MTISNPSAIILVPGLWLGGWAWDEVAERLARGGLSPVPVTLPGLDSPTARRDGIRLFDHVRALLDVVRGAAGRSRPVVLVAHSGAGTLATAILDQAPDLVRRVVYVDSGPVANGTIARPDLDPTTVDVPLPTWDQLEAGGASLAGLTQEMLQHFQERAVPHPAGPLREPIRLNNPERNHVPATVLCCSIPSEALRHMATGEGMFAPLADLTDVRYTDLPTGHWPMWSAPDALADTIAKTAQD
ncbi:MAG: alpha/beta hydrolase [Micrococcales bacterium]|nr:alpha/beta hydrolase [Micrococcales bacterium]